MNKVYIAEQLNIPNIASLLNGDLTAVRFLNYYPVDICNEIAERLISSSLLGYYVNAEKIGRVGRAFFESLVSEEYLHAYQAHAVEWIRELRNLCSPYLTPIDKLRLDLDETWPSGATVATLDGKKMFVGLARIFDDGSNCEPHQDRLDWDAPNVQDAKSLEAQLAANIYLRMPPHGGKLLIWPRSLSKTEYEAGRNSGSYGVSTSALDCSPICITPSVGELVLFNSRLVHAVTDSIGGNRVTASCFIGYRNENSPLVMWS